MAAHDPKEGAREKAGWGLPVPAPAGARATERVIDELFAAPKDAAADADPVASLFQDNRALPAPAIADLQSEAEITRWRAAGNTSLFDESVPDPVPSAANASHSVRTRNPANALSVPPPVPPAARKAAVPPSSASLPPVPVSLAPASLSMAPLVAASGDDAPSRKRRIERGPKKGMLAAIGVAAALSLGSAAVVLQLIPNPFAARLPASAPAPAHAHAHAPAPAPAPAPVAATRAPAAPVSPAPPMAVPVQGFKPAPVPATPPPAEAVAVVAAAEPALAAPVAAAAMAAPAAPVAAPTAATGAPVAAAPRVETAKPVAAKPEAKSVALPTNAPAVAVVAPPAAPADAAETSAGGEQNQRLISAASKKLAEDDPKGAEALMRDALARDPDDHHAMEVLVRALIDQDRGAEAVPYARRMVKRRSKRVPYRLLLGDALLMTGDENGARREWKAALEIEPNDRQVRMRLGM